MKGCIFQCTVLPVLLEERKEGIVTEGNTECFQEAQKQPNSEIKRLHISLF